MTITTQLDTPVKIIWSAYHDLAIVISRHCLQTIAKDGETEIIQSSTSHVYTDMDVWETGEVLTVMRPLASDGDYVVRILHRDLTKIATEFRTDIPITLGCLTSSSEFVVAGEVEEWAVATEDSSSEDSSSSHSLSSSSGLDQSAIRFFSLQNGTIATDGILVTGNLDGLVHPDGQNFVLAMSSAGDVVCCPLILPYDEQLAPRGEGRSAFLVKNIGSLSTACGGLRWVEEGAADQSKVRVFVGSQMWQNDRWDSGEIPTSKTSILYGGGDNLVPGQAYWVHIATYHEDSGWGAPSITRFVVPKE